MSDSFAAKVEAKIVPASVSALEVGFLSVIQVMNTLERYADHAAADGDKGREMAYRESWMQLRMSLGRTFGVDFHV